MKEKLEIIASFEKCENKRQTANKENCTPAQLRKWIKEKDKLVNLHRSKKGKLLYSYLIRVCLSVCFRKEKMSGGWWWEKVSVRRSRSSSFGVVPISPNRSAWARTVKNFDFNRAFMDIGYTWIDDSPISPRTLPGFSFDPTTVLPPAAAQHESELDSDDQRPVNEANRHPAVTPNNNPMKQLRLDQFIRRH